MSGKNNHSHTANSNLDEASQSISFDIFSFFLGQGTVACDQIRKQINLNTDRYKTYSKNYCRHDWICLKN